MVKKERERIKAYKLKSCNCFYLLVDIGVTLIVVVCVGFLLFMIVLGVIRIRAAHQRSQVVTVDSEKPEMEWDNSALTITVNPMEQDVSDYIIFSNNFLVN